MFGYQLNQHYTFSHTASHGQAMQSLSHMLFKWSDSPTTEQEAKQVSNPGAYSLLGNN